MSQITDVLGLTSQFSYDASSLINVMTTPYGKTQFAYGETGLDRWIEVTDPAGFKERVEFRQKAMGISYSEPNQAVPKGILTYNFYMDGRNSFYWDKHAYQVAPGDYTKARIRHWTHVPTDLTKTGHTVESVKLPLENRLWFGYPGQAGTFVGGTLDQPSRIARVLDNGTTFITQLTYNNLGHVTGVIDPVGREIQLVYDTNDIDVLRVQQKTSASGYSTLSELTYNKQHLLLTRKDMAGQTTTYGYNSEGHLTQVTDPLGQVTKLEYDSFGYLTRIVNANGNTAVSFTYDDLGRIGARTDSEG